MKTVLLIAGILLTILSAGAYGFAGIAYMAMKTTLDGTASLAHQQQMIAIISLVVGIVLTILTVVCFKYRKSL